MEKLAKAKKVGKAGDLEEKLKKDVLYKGKKGFAIRERLGDVEYFSERLQDAVIKYGISATPDLKEPSNIAEVILNHLMSDRFDNAIRYPVYPNTDYNNAIMSIARSILNITKKKLEKGESFSDLFQKIIDEFKEIKDRYLFDLLSR